MTGCIDDYRYNVTNRSMYVMYGWMENGWMCGYVFGCGETQEWSEGKVLIWDK
jgi:hypothetical protein